MFLIRKLNQQTSLTKIAVAWKRNAILGCYNPSSRDIYIYNVTNSELDGVKEVTAAHEMLHAAWERLSESENLI